MLFFDLGGIYYRGSCICGSATSGFRCEFRDDSSFLHSSIAYTHKFSGHYLANQSYNWEKKTGQGNSATEIKITELANDIIAWGNGRIAEPEKMPKEDINPQLLDIMMKNGPWLPSDIVTMRQLEMYQRSPKLPLERRCAWGFMLHGNYDNFEAVWRALYSSTAVFAIHIDTKTEPKFRKQVEQLVKESRETVGNGVDNVRRCSHKTFRTVILCGVFYSLIIRMSFVCRFTLFLCWIVLVLFNMQVHHFGVKLF